MFSRNKSENWSGGAIAVWNARIECYNSRFTDNMSDSSGGGIEIYHTSGTSLFVNTLFEANRSPSSGGALYAYGNTDIYNCTLT